ncbi:hypothetical protein ACO2RV_24255 [Ancylobacter sp. VNQ12]|uniref:hypothetical protein n=1 Tax=Ancylobacter sp. VNQ12 TaxID=3400920 RepID=UPI003BFAE11E
MPDETTSALKALTHGKVQTSHLRQFPGMTGWFDPRLLLKLLWHVILADAFGQYADRRLMEAALDPATEQEHFTRACDNTIAPDEDGAVWIDYVSDLGDGFDATYAIACLLGEPSLDIDGQQLPRGQILVMGGDQVYPTSLRDDYKIKMQLPYEFASPRIKGEDGRPLYVVPGNHDWYDGLVTFLALFCRAKPTRIGSWATKQRRSYFAVKLTDNWWLWAIDIALVRDMDQPQADYFVGIAKGMAENSNVILCSAEPGWYSAEVDGDAYRTLSYAAGIAKNADKSLRLPLTLSGDSHHYARYVGANGHYITSGGGAAFLHGTLELKDAIKATWLEPETDLRLENCYPSKEESSRLLLGNWRFPFLNPGLGLAISGLYLLAAFALASLWHWDVGLIIYAILFLGFWGYGAYQESSSAKVTLLAAAHALAHMLVILGLAGIERWAEGVWGWAPWPFRLLVLTVPTFTIGWLLAGLIYGVSLLVSCRYFGISHNDAFSAMKLASHRHFLRLRIKGDQVTVYPIKLDRTPKRSEWAIPEPRPARGPVFVPTPRLQPELIEEPIVIKARGATSTEDVKPAAELPEN